MKGALMLFPVNRPGIGSGGQIVPSATPLINCIA